MKINYIYKERDFMYEAWEVDDFGKTLNFISSISFNDLFFGALDPQMRLEMWVEEIEKCTKP